MAPDPLAFSIADAAQFVGLSKSQFRRIYIDGRRIKTLRTGKRDRTVDAAELRAAYSAYTTEQRQATAG